MKRILVILLFFGMGSCDNIRFGRIAKYDKQLNDLWSQFLSSGKNTKSLPFAKYIERNFTNDSEVYLIYSTKIDSGFLVNDTVVNRVNSVDLSECTYVENKLSNATIVNDRYKIHRKVDLFKNHSTGKNIDVISLSMDNTNNIELKMVWIK